MAPRGTDRSNTVIYKIVCRDLSVPDLYVGSTSNMTHRRAKHKSDSKKPEKVGLKIYARIAETGGWENWNMVVVEEYPDCESGEQARTREREWYERLGASLNMVRPYRSNAEAVETAVAYRVEHSEQISERAAQYYVENREQISERAARYRTENREQISEDRARYRTENREQIREYQAQYQADNREQISEKARAKYQEKKAAAALTVANP